MCHGKEEIYSEIELITYQLKWYSPTNIISLAQLRSKLVLLLTEIFTYCHAQETRRLLFFRDSGSHVVRATIQQNAN